MSEKERKKDVSAQCECWLVPYLQDTLYIWWEEERQMYVPVYIYLLTCVLILDMGLGHTKQSG